MRHLPPLHKDSGPDQERPRRAGRGRTGDDAIKPLGSRARIRKSAAKLAGHLAESQLSRSRWTDRSVSFALIISSERPCWHDANLFQGDSAPVDFATPR